MPKGRQYAPELTLAEAVASPTYQKFREAFGEHDAKQVLVAGAHWRERDRLSDCFVDCLAVAVAYECFTEFRVQHKFSAPSESYLRWIREEVSFAEYINETLKESPLNKYKKTFKTLDLYR